jgi:hypothetical protein
VPEASQCGWRLISGQQGQRSVESHIQGAFQSREDARELRAEAVDGACTVTRQICAACSEDLEFRHDVVPWTHGVQIASHAGLVRDDRRVTGIGLALAAVGARGAVYDAAGDVEQFLIVIDQECDQQRGTTICEINSPGDLATERQNISQEL